MGFNEENRRILIITRIIDYMCQNTKLILFIVLQFYLPLNLKTFKIDLI